jgi:O-antigen ligase
MLGVALIFCLFGNLYLARRAETLRRWALYVACLLMLPVIFWTQTRSVWLAAIACASIWLLAGSHRRPRIVLVCVATALAIAALVVNWANVSSVERSRGGVAEAAPIELRFALAKLTFDIAADHPLFGVGFGHFRDHAAQYARDPSSPAMQVASTAVEHNNFLSVLAETGVVGLAIYLWLLLHLLWRSVRLYRRMPAGFLDGRGRDFVVLYWVLYANHVVDAMFRETSVHPFDNCLFFAVSGAMVAIDLMARRQGSTAPVPTA